MKLKLSDDYNFLIPHAVPMLRLGNKGDGGYVIPKIALTAQGLVSFGLGGNWTFEQDWLKLKPKSFIQAYDGTVDISSDFFTGTVSYFKENVSLENIDSILERGGNNYFLKMDIEGCEWDLFPAILESKSIVGMVIEFHNLDFENRRIHLKQVITALNDNYKVVHVHANNYSGICEDNLPNTLEISFLRNNLCGTKVKRYNVYLPGIDSPNSLTTEEIMLYFDSGDN